MIETVILTLCFLLLLIAAYISLRLARVSGSRYPWVILAAGLVLVFFTNILALNEMPVEQFATLHRVQMAVIALAFSALMLSGLFLVKPGLIIAIHTDQEAKAKQARAASYLDSSPGIVLALDKTGTVVLVNRGGCILLDHDKNSILGQNWFSKFLPEHEKESAFESFRNVIAGEHEIAEFLETEILTKSGSHVPIRWANTLVRDADDVITGMLSTGTDISRHRELADRLAESEELFEHVVKSAAVGIIVISDKGTVRQVNPFAEDMFGYKADEILGNNVSMLMSSSESEHHDNYIDTYLRTGRKKIIGTNREISGQRKNGESFPLHLGVSEVIGSGRKDFVGILTDLTERKLVEGRLRHSQKMEIVGQLTGGVAHDFNNLLAVILGNLFLLEDVLKDEGDLTATEIGEFIQPALAAGKRGADLTQRLLAFSRKQPLRPVPLDINNIVKDMEDLVKRTLGEDIEISWRLNASTWLTEADKSQLDNVLLNLAVNARDAMPQGGTLIIETDEVTLDNEYGGSHGEIVPGKYLMLAVRDSGTGMSASTLDKVFEPFFTTKEVGKGTGLGLSMVYGFAKQSGGHVSIYSEMGEGTTVKVYLPRTDATKATDTVVLDETHSPRPLEGRETILIVEDEAAVLQVTMRILERLGYQILDAADGHLALEILAGDNHVDLLLTDVVLPGGMSGRDVAKQAQENDPGLKILYMSGYTENAILHQGRVGDGISLISKPFSNRELGERVREELDRMRG